MPDFDIAIIGTGAVGGTLAYTLAPTGKRILILARARTPERNLVKKLVEDRPISQPRDVQHRPLPSRPLGQTAHRVLQPRQMLRSEASLWSHHQGPRTAPTPAG